MKIKPLIQLLLICTNLVFGANRYVNSATGNDGNTGLIGAPWQTLTKLNNTWSSISDGDTVFLARGSSWAPSGIGSSSGVLQPTSYKAGTTGSYIVISAYGSGALPIVSNVSSPTAYCFRGNGLSYWVFEYIEFRGDFMIKPYTGYPYHHVKILHCTFDGQYGSGSRRGGIYTTEPVTEVSAENYTYNDVYDIEIGYCEVMNVQNETGRSINFDTGTRNYWIHHCIVHGGTGAGVGINLSQGIGSVIEYNTIYNCGAGIKIIPQRNRSDSVIIRGNLIYGLTDASGFGISLQNSRGSQVYNNTVYLGSAYGSALFGWLPSNPVNFCGLGTWGFEDNIIANNIFYGQIILGTPNNVGIRYYGRSDTIRYTHNIDSLKILNTWTHNIYYPVSGTALLSEDREATGCVTWSTSQGVYSYTTTGRTYPTVATTSNFNTNWNGSKPSITDEINANPLFINPTTFNFRIPSNSPAYETGSDIVSYTTDLDGYTIYGDPSIGAYDHFTPPPPEVTGQRKVLIRHQ